VSVRVPVHTDMDRAGFEALVVAAVVVFHGFVIGAAFLANSLRSRGWYPVSLSIRVLTALSRLILSGERSRAQPRQSGETSPTKTMPSTALPSGSSR
jgi:hypothetical protein